MNARIEKLRMNAADSKAGVCGERGVIVTESFKKNNGEPQSIRRALAFQDILEKMSIRIDENELIVGNHSTKERYAPLFPEFSIDFLINEIDTFETRPYDKFEISEEVKNIIREIAPYWKGATHEDMVVKTTRRIMPKDYLIAWEEDKFRLNDVLYDGVRKSAGDGHVTVDYFKWVNHGIKGILNEVDEARAKLDVTNVAEDYEKEIYLQSVEISYKAASAFILRFADLAIEMAKNENDARKAELLKIAEVCKNISYDAPTSFYEALQLSYFLHLLIHIESNGHSVSFGRMDMFLFPFFEKDIKAGTITEEDALELIECFYVKVSCFNKVRPWPETRLKSGAPMFMTLTLGGMGEDGVDNSNRLTWLFLEGLTHTRLPQPTPVLRVCETTPKELLVHSAEVLFKHGGGLPAYFSDESIIDALLATGIPLEDARRYAICGCSEAVVPGKTFSFTGGDCYFNFLKILEIILHEGVNPRTGIKLFESKKLSELTSIDVVINEFKRHLETYMKLIVPLTGITSKVDLILNPTPFTSGALNFRIQEGKDMSEGGGESAKYSHTILQGHGTADISNALYVLEEMVFNKKQISLEEFVKVLDSNWEGERGKEVKLLAKKIAKYGNDEEAVDKYATTISNFFADEAQKYKPLRGGVFGTSLQGLTANVPEGETVGATPDGRIAEEALSDNISPHAGTDINGPTSTLLSVAKVDHTKFIDGNILNLRFHPSALTTSQGDFDKESGDKFANMVKTYLVDLKGNQVQFNILTADNMRNAQKNPEKYRDLVVKVAGYSAYFNSLDRGLQDQIIERTEHKF